MTLGEVIKQYREEHDLSMGEFADLSGISKSYVYVLEKGKHPKTGKPVNPSNESVKQVADAIGVSISQLRSMIEPLDWNSEIYDRDPSQADLSLDKALWEARQSEPIGDIPHFFEVYKKMMKMDETTKKRFLRYADFLLQVQKEEKHD